MFYDFSLKLNKYFYRNCLYKIFPFLYKYFTFEIKIKMTFQKTSIFPLQFQPSSLTKIDLYITTLTFQSYFFCRKKQSL